MLEQLSPTEIKLLWLALAIIVGIPTYWAIKYCRKDFLDDLKEYPIGSLDSRKRGRR